jgi:Trk K+ transport system NAD-binding subunit
MPYATGETPEVGDYIKNQWEQPGTVTRVHFAQDEEEPTQIVPRYAQVMDENRLDAMKKLKALKQSAVGGHEAVESPSDETVQGIRQ